MREEEGYDMQRTIRRVVRKGEMVHELENGFYLVKVICPRGEVIAIPPLPPEDLLYKLSRFSYCPIPEGKFTRIYHPEKGALKTFILEGPMEKPKKVDNSGKQATQQSGEVN
ncbi:MAG: hypothetical protein AABX71_02245 [Nanoarchaeota archaeon]